MRWAVGLEEIHRLEVERVRGRRGFSVTGRGGTISTGSVDLTLCVIVDSTIVYVGDPRPCGILQQAIDDARTSRCLELYGRLIPFRPGSPIRGSLLTPGATGEDGLPSAPSPPATPNQTFDVLLFIAGEPFEDAVPMAQTPTVSARGSRLGVVSAGGHEPADELPGQVYGAQAEMARMVLDIALKCQVSVKVVDVDNSGADLALVQKWVSPVEDLPILLKLDGSRIQGSESMVPVKVAEFLRRA